MAWCNPDSPVAFQILLRIRATAVFKATAAPHTLEPPAAPAHARYLEVTGMDDPKSGATSPRRDSASEWRDDDAQDHQIVPRANELPTEQQGMWKASSKHQSAAKYGAKTAPRITTCEGARAFTTSPLCLPPLLL